MSREDELNIGGGEDSETVILLSLKEDEMEEQRRTEVHPHFSAVGYLASDQAQCARCYDHVIYFT